MKYIVLDMEWNRLVSRNAMIKHPIKLKGEIIQIGAVMLDENLEEIDNFDVMICPKFYKRMHKEVEALTSITTADLESGKSFENAMVDFSSWCGKDSAILTWGPCDRNRLEENFIVNNLSYDWLPEIFDAQLMFDVQETMEERQFSLDYALYYFGLSGTKAHNALNDARDTASVVRELDVDGFIQEEREWRKECESMYVA